MASKRQNAMRVLGLSACDKGQGSATEETMGEEERVKV
jgi:hypothetical protein